MNSYINASCYELYELLVGEFEDYYTNNLFLTLDGSTDGYDLSTLGFVTFKIRGLDKSISGNSSATDWYPVRAFDWNDRDRANRTVNKLYRTLLGYKWVGSILKLSPLDQVAGTYRLWYIPDFVPLVNDSDTIPTDFVRWADYLVVDCVIKALQKEETDPAVFVMQKEQLKARIMSMAAGRDAGGQERVGDVTRNGYDPDLPFRY